MTMASKTAKDITSATSLEDTGWCLTEEGLTLCMDMCSGNGKPQTQVNVTAEAKNVDLRKIGRKFLPDVSKGTIKEIPGGKVLQIQKVFNVAVPSLKHHDDNFHKSRLLKLHLTDGHVHCLAVEYGLPIQGLRPSTSPGTKLKLISNVSVINGFLLLTAKSTVILGGHVEHMIKKWDLEKTSKTFQRMTISETGPPPFTITKTKDRPVQKVTSEHSQHYTTSPKHMDNSDTVKDKDKRSASAKIEVRHQPEQLYQHHTKSAYVSSKRSQHQQTLQQHESTGKSQHHLKTSKHYASTGHESYGKAHHHKGSHYTSSGIDDTDQQLHHDSVYHTTGSRSVNEKYSSTEAKISKGHTIKSDQHSTSTTAAGVYNWESVVIKSNAPLSAKSTQ